MPGDITENMIEPRLEPALVGHSGDPGRKLLAVDHLADEPPPVYGGEAVSQNRYNEFLPTEEELHVLRRVPAKIPWKVYTIAFVELCERMSYYGTIAVFSNFIAQSNGDPDKGIPPTNTGRAWHPNDPEAQPGALGMGSKASQGIITFNQFWIYLMPLFGAYVADRYLGRFKTIMYAVVIAEIGHILLTVSAAPSMIKKPKDSLACFLVGLIIMGIGTGAFKPNVSPLIAEQIPQERMRVETTRKGERVIVDPVVTASRIYSYFYLFINIGALVGQLSMVYAERYVGFYVSFLIPTSCFLTTFPVLLFCRKYYIMRKPEGSVLGLAVRLLFMGLRNGWQFNPLAPWKHRKDGTFWQSVDREIRHLNPLAIWKHWNDGTFWQNIKPSYLGADKPAWMTFDDAWVDEVARGFSACSVLLWFPLYWITYNQINNNLTFQASTMLLHGVPNDVLQNIDPLVIMILIPLMDLVIYPFLRKKGIKFTPIKRITAGFFLGTSAMIWAAVVQYYIYKTSPCGSHATAQCKAPLNVGIQAGAYVLVAASEIFASVTSLEYAFTKAPKNMRSLVQAFALFMTAISAAVGEALLPLSVNPLLVWNYGTMAVISFVAGCIFWFQNRQLDRDEDKLNMLPTGHVGTQAQAGDIEGRLGLSSEK